jgi:hypothetical protein
VKRPDLALSKPPRRMVNHEHAEQPIVLINYFLSANDRVGGRFA